MDQLSAVQSQLIGRLRSAALELGQSEPSVLFCQVWTSAACSLPLDQPTLKVEAQSLITPGNEVIRTYASLSLVCGIRQEAMDLIGDCHRKGATRIIEDLEHADCTQHPRNFLPGHNIPACSALFLPLFDLAEPFVKQPLGSVSAPTAVLEILVCETAKVRHNNSDLINIACEMLDRYQFGITADSTAYKKWSKLLPGRVSGVTSSSRSSVSPVRTMMSRTVSTSVLYSDDSTDSVTLGQDSAAQSSPYNSFGKRVSGLPLRAIS